MENPDDIKLSKTLSESKEGINAQFYRAYCHSENKWLGSWNSDRQVAVNSKNHHERNNSSHSISIQTR